MKLNRDAIISAIIAEKESFLQFVDYINQNNTGGEFPKKQYIFYYENILAKKVQYEPHNHILQSYLKLLSLDSLKDNMIFNEFPKTGMLIFNKLIIELLGFVDTKRNKQLFHAQFEMMRNNIIDYRKLIETSPIGSTNYNEALTGLIEKLGEIQCKVQENDLVLKSRVEEFSVEYYRFEQNQGNISLSDLYLQVESLYERNVHPFLQFTTTDKIVVGGTFSEHLDGLIYFFEKNDDAQQSINLSYRKTGITSFYKDVLQTAKRVKYYLDELGKRKSHFLTNERAYAGLIEILESKRHGGIKHVKIHAKEPFFECINTFDGLSSHKQKYKTRLTIAPKENIGRFVYLIEKVREKSLSAKEAKLVPLPPRQYTNLNRQVQVAKVMYGLKVPAHIEDMYQYIDQVLIENLPDYLLHDILYGIEAIFPRLRAELKGTDQRGRIQDNKHYLDYSVVQYSKDIKHG